MLISVGSIAGDQEQEFRKELIKALKKNKDFKVPKDVKDTETITDSVYAARASLLKGKKQALIVISGTYKSDKDERRKTTTEANNVSKEYMEKTVEGRFSFRVTDLSNNKLLLARDVGGKSTSTEKIETKSFIETILDIVGSDPLEQKTREEVIDAFINQLYPHEEVFHVKFYKDSELPELETGITHANIGQWDKTIELFESTVDKYPKDKNVHKAYYNLGVAYKWNNMFVEARTNLEKAYLMKNSSEYYNEIQSLTPFEQEYRTRQEQK